MPRQVGITRRVCSWARDASNDCQGRLPSERSSRAKPTNHLLCSGLLMVVSTGDICPFGWKARDFALKSVDGKTYSLADIRGPKGTLVVFICNHCPYVKASISRIVAEANALRQIGIGTIAIMSNDTESYPEDSFDNIRAFAAHHGFSFPYVIDTTQEVARAYGAQCTPARRLPGHLGHTGPARAREIIEEFPPNSGKGHADGCSCQCFLSSEVSDMTKINVLHDWILQK